MGGWGSGRHDYATTPTVEESRSMDIDELKEATEHPDADGVIWWGDREDPDAHLAWFAEGERDLGDDTRADAIRFKYTIRNPRTDESRPVEYVAPLDYTECNFGGVRPWFRCPECRDRRRKLYLPPRGGDGRYLCRECYDLGYQSSRTSGDDLKQAESRYRRAFAKADKHNRRPHPNGEPSLPERPKGMHHDTFDKLCWQVRLAELEWTEEMRKQTNQLLEHVGAEDRVPHPLDD